MQVTDHIKQIACAIIMGAIFLTSGFELYALADDNTPLELDGVTVQATALKMGTEVLETPKSVSVISQEEMEQHAPQKLDEALRYTSSVTAQPYGSDNDTDWFKVRGFDAATYLDGNKLFRDGYYTWLLEPYGLEQVEVVKGSASILYGESPPGGLVNAVQKKPTDTPSGEVRIQYGTNNMRSGSFDVSDLIKEDGSMRFRIVGLLKQEDGELNGTENTRQYLAPSLIVEGADNTQLTLKATFLKDDGVPTNPFFPVAGTLIDSNFGSIDPSTNLGEPDYDKYERTQISIGYLLEHELDSVWKLSQNVNFGYNELYLRSSYAFPNSDPTVDTVNRGLAYRDGESTSITIDNKAVAKWNTENMKHTAMFGIDLQRHETDGVEQENYAFGAINPFDPVYGTYTPLDSANDIDRSITKSQIGTYAQYQLKYDDHWVGIFGGRYDRINSENISEKKLQDKSRTDGEISLNTGLMYLADNGISPYASYSQSFEVLSTIDPATGNLYKPLKGEQVEVGVKYTPDFFDGYLNAALFDITQKNALVTNPTTFVATQTGEVTSRGIELEGSGTIYDGVKLTANYTYTNALTDDTGGQGTKQAAMIPKHMASAWLDFDVATLGVEGLTIGNGVRYIGMSKDSPASSNLTVPSVILWDAMVSYDIDKNWSTQLNVNNILDKEYISSCNYYAYYGQSRSAVLSLSYHW